MVKILIVYFCTIPCIAFSKKDIETKQSPPSKDCVLIATPERKVKSAERDTSKLVPGICVDQEKKPLQKFKRNVN